MLAFAFAFDIDGVLLRGKRALPGAVSALTRLDAMGVPYALLTNGGGTLEAVKAAAVAKALAYGGVREDRVVVSHTPLRRVVAQQGRRDERVLVLGCRDELNVARAYGWRKVVSPQQLVVQHPDTYDNWGRNPLPLDSKAYADALSDPFRNEPIKAIAVMHDPVDWHLELQIVLDVLRGYIDFKAPTTPTPTHSEIPIFTTNDDLEFAGTHAHPRMAQGLFMETLEHLYAKVAPSKSPKLDIRRFGKPHKVTFDYARELLGSPKHMYMVGDNPAADIRGANQAKPHWTSILVRSGMHRGDADNVAALPSSDRPDVVVDGVLDAVEWALRRHVT